MKPDTTNELKSCPFCGSDAVELNGYNIWKVSCSNEFCRVSEAVFLREDWNTRTSDTLQNQKLREALELMVDFAEHQMHPMQNDPSNFEDEDFGNLKLAKELLGEDNE